MSIELLYGPETYLLENKVKRIKKSFGELIQGINLVQLDATTVNNIISDIETPAFGYEKKLIIARDTGLFKKEKKAGKKASVNNNQLTGLGDKLAQYIEDNQQIFLEAVELIFIEEEVEKNALYKAIEKIGNVQKFDLLKLPQLIDNITKICNAYKVHIDVNTAKYFIECCGTNMQDLINEIRKLIEHAGENGTITKNDVDLLSVKQLDSIIFDLTDSLGKRDIAKALEVLHNLLYAKEPIQRILVTLYNHFKKLYITKIAVKYKKDLAEAMQLKPNQVFLTSKYKAQASYFTEGELKQIMKELVDLDANYKVGLIDLNVGLESILCRYCS